MGRPPGSAGVGLSAPISSPWTAGCGDSAAIPSVDLPTVATLCRPQTRTAPPPPCEGTRDWFPANAASLSLWGLGCSSGSTAEGKKKAPGRSPHTRQQQEKLINRQQRDPDGPPRRNGDRGDSLRFKCRWSTPERKAHDPSWPLDLAPPHPCARSPLRRPYGPSLVRDRSKSPGGAGLGLLSTLCVCGCLWADVVREGSGLAEQYETYLLGRIRDVEAQRSALEAEVSELRAQVEGAPSAAPQRSTHSPCSLCGYWSADQRQVAGHITQCQRRAARSRALASEAVASNGPA